MSEEDIDDEVVAKVSDYLDGLLGGTERDAVAAKIEADPVWKQTHTDMVENRKFMSGMRKARAPEQFTQDVTDTIYKRSAGRFFARKTLGDRVPWSAIVIVAIIALAAVGYLMWSSQTGSLKVDQRESTPPSGSASDIKPRVGM